MILATAKIDSQTTFTVETSMGAFAVKERRMVGGDTQVSVKAIRRTRKQALEYMNDEAKLKRWINANL
jgi:uncharacterized protein YbjQ (UPF0145 family)